jgi:chaperonin GroES
VTEAGALIPLTLEVGQRVVYGKYAGTPFTIDNMQLIVLSEADLLAVLRT